MSTKRKFILNILFIWLLPLHATIAQTVTIDLAKTHQVIRGFGGMNHTVWIGDLNPDNREKAFGNNPGEMGLTILRIHVDPDPNKFALELPTAKFAIQKGALVFATPWNAPNDLLDPNTSPGHVDPAKYGQLADHLNAFNTFMDTNGAPLYAISVQNEPDYGEWTRWTASEMVDFIAGYGQNIDNKLIAPESFQFRRSFTDPILNDTNVVKNLDIVGGHIYGGGLADYPLAREKGKEVWMTEHLLGNRQNETNDWNLALTFGKEISDCLKANFNTYVYWYIRRFFGLITEDGNISDKGYVISQFSKFVRPGALRVDVDDSQANLVDVTAFKTDTSFVAVVINRNAHSVNLDFNLMNGNVGTLTQFTSSASQKVTNDGQLVVSGNSFSATVAAYSVTTFTTDSAPGGKYGNIPPVASAGRDTTVTDSLGNGYVDFALQGAGSTDSDGHIINYSWSENEKQIAWEANPNLTLNVGDHTLLLTITDDDGAIATDTVKVSVKSLYTGNVWLEAECTEVGSNWDVHADSSCSNGKYLMVKPGIEAKNAPASDKNNILVYPFSVPEDGRYKVWGRVLAPSADDDSFWIRIDDGDWVNWNGIQGGKTWRWDNVHNQSNDHTMIYNLNAGEHTLRVSYREDGTGIDKFYITDTGRQPTGMGEDATNCETSTNVDRFIESDQAIRLYPNPVRSVVHVESASPFSTLKMFNLNGGTIWNKRYPPATVSAEIDLNVDNGIYLLQVAGNEHSSVVKFIVNK